MANIPLAEFPNAPAYPVESALIQPPTVNFNFADLTAGIDSLMQAEISNDSMRTYSRGLNQLAQGISSLGDLPDRVANKLLDEKNDGDIADVGNQVAAASDKLQASLATMPPAEARTALENESAALRDHFASQQFAPVVQRHADQLVSRYQQTGLARIQHAEQVALIERNKGVFLTSVNRAFDEGKYDLADAQLQDMVRRGYLTADAAEARYQQSIGERHRRIEQAEIAEDPISVAEDMQAASKTGHSTLFARSMSKDEISRTLGTATTAVRSLQYGAAKEILLGQRDGSMASEEDIRKRASAARLPDEVVTGLVHGLNHVEPDDNPEIIAYFRENQMSARANVAAYNPANDPTQKKLFALIGDINERVPTFARPALLDELFKRREGESPNRLRGEIFSTINRYRENGLFGRWNFERDQENRYSPPDRARAAAVAGEAMDQMDKFFKENPSATQAQANAKLHEIVGDDTRANAAKVMIGHTPFPIYNNPTVFATPLLPNFAEIPQSDEKLVGSIDSILGPASVRPNTTPNTPMPFDAPQPSLGASQP